MKTFTAALALTMLALPAVPAYSQAKRPHTEEKKVDKKPVVDEQAYQAALKRIPDSKEKYDPWGVARPAEPVKKPK